MNKFDKLNTGLFAEQRTRFRTSATRTRHALSAMLTLAALCALVTFAACKHPTNDSGKTTYYTVTFEANGGSDVPAQTVASGTTATKPSTPKKADHLFGGWYTDSTCTDRFDFATKITSDTTLYAEWKKSTIKMIPIDSTGTTFQMGSTGSMAQAPEKPVHDVTLTRMYEMSTHEVTQYEWSVVFGNNPSYYSGNPAAGEEQENRPVESVTWYMAIAYCNKLSLMAGLTPCYSVKVDKEEVDWENLAFSVIPTESNDDWNKVECNFDENGYRLPTEAEWEYAARGRELSTTAAVWAGTTDSAKVGEYAWYSANSNSKTHEVMKLKPNDYGLYDMSGNVFEWCWDWYGNYTADAAT
ncbi:MAG: SUMF1/EgtB/PvdO family nonheme iron enzyme, partial [Treponema sp.]|nr:SUMF1/EgtB/PvdO family nonheme iron enzyme [Treponema sp.]